MGTPHFAVPGLRKLIETQDVVAVVTQPDRPAGRGRQLQASPVKIVAEAAGIPVYQPKSLRSQEAAGPLRQWQPDVIVVAAFGQILRPHVLALPPHGCLNVHASLLPRWRGASPIQHAILAGDAETGVSLMQMNEGLDTGPVFVQQLIAIQPDDTATSLHDRLAELGAAMLGLYLDDILAGRVAATSQRDDLATYAPLIKKEDGRIDWQKAATELERHVRAMTPWPGAFTTWQGQQLKIVEAQTVDVQQATGQPGLVVAYQESAYQESAVVLAKRGGLLLQQVQLAGKRATPVGDFLHGHPDFIGSKLGE